MSSEFAGLLKKAASNTQSLCVSASGNDVSLITLKLEATQGMSLRTLVDCAIVGRRTTLYDANR